MKCFFFVLGARERERERGESRPYEEKKMVIFGEFWIFNPLVKKVKIVNSVS